MPDGATVLPGQFSLLHMLAPSVCLVWGKAGAATRPFRTILHDVLNGQAASIAIARVLCRISLRAAPCINTHVQC